MIERVKRVIIGGVLVGVVSSCGLSFMMSMPAVADAKSDGAACNGGRFLTFPAWYSGVTVASRDDQGNLDCTPSPDATGGDLTKFIWKIVFNVVNIMLQLVGYLCIGYIIYGGWKYLTSAGESDRIASGRKLILNAAIGLVISFFAVAFVTLIGASIK